MGFGNHPPVGDWNRVANDLGSSTSTGFGNHPPGGSDEPTFHGTKY